MGLLITLIGVVVGLGVALGFSRLIASYLYGVSAYDPTTFFGVAAVLRAWHWLSCYIPARRAMRVDLMVALRYE